MATKKRNRKRKSQNPTTLDHAGSDTPRFEEGQSREEEQAAYDSVSVTGSGRDVTAEEPTEALTEPQPEAPTMDDWEYQPAKALGPAAPNFTHREVAKSSTADRYNIDNTPEPQILRGAYGVAENCLQKIREEFGPFTANSWYRCEALERIIARQGFVSWCAKNNMPSDTSSWDTYFGRKSHPKGMAVDFEIIGVPNDELYTWCVSNLTFDQCIREFPKEGDPSSGWVHISYNATSNRGEAFTIG